MLIIIIYIVVKMGQDQSIPQQQNSARQYNTQRYQSVQHQQKIEHEGILKLRTTPFPNCIQIDSGGCPLFLQNAQTTLSDLLQGRLYTNRLFPYEDVQKMIEDIVYTLAHFQSFNVSYRYLCPQNIYYCKGSFKLLPNQLIDETALNIACRNLKILNTQLTNKIQEFVPLSPEMIIAMRHNEYQIDDQQILNKSNVFILGLVLLQVCTMLPSSECYDHLNYDIFSNIVTERLEMVEDHYNTKIARIIANMIDYDYVERMLMKDIAIWINRQFCVVADKNQQQYQSSNSQKSKTKISAVKSQIVQSEDCQQVEKYRQIEHCDEEAPPQRIIARSNNVYVNKYNDLKEEKYSQFVQTSSKNAVYMNYQQNQPQSYSKPTEKLQKDKNKKISNTIFQRQEVQHRQQGEGRMRQQKQSKNRHDEYLQIQQNNKNPEKLYPNTRKSSYDYVDHAERIKSNENNTPPEVQKRKRYEYDYHQEYEHNQHEIHQRHKNNRDNHLKQIKNVRQDKRIQVNPYMNSYKIDKMDKMNKMDKNRFYPSVNQLQQYEESSDTRRMTLHSEVGNIKKRHQNYSKHQVDDFESKQSDSKASINDGSINRIKLEIEKSRKLIEQFRKSEGIPKF